MRNSSSFDLLLFVPIIGVMTAMDVVMTGMVCVMTAMDVVMTGIVCVMTGIGLYNE